MNELFVFLGDFHALVRESFDEEFPRHAGNGGEQQTATAQRIVRLASIFNFTLRGLGRRH
jgi:hypothetical protein